jgi:hypothetical protein
MKTQPLIGAYQGHKKTNLTASENARIGIKKDVSPFRQFISKFKEIIGTILIIAFLIALLKQRLYRDLLLAWLKDILEKVYQANVYLVL